MRFEGEIEDLETARAIGDRWGYGNVIQYLQQAWDKKTQKSSLSFAPKIDKKDRPAFIKAWKAHFNRKHSVLKEDQP